MTQSLLHMLAETAARQADKHALRYRRADILETISYGQMLDTVREIAGGLASLGLGRGDRVAILSDNRPEWTMTDFAVFHIRGVVVPVYTTLPANQVAYILGNANVQAIFVDSKAQLDKVMAIKDELPELKHILGFEPLGEDVTTLETIREQGRQFNTAHPDFLTNSMKTINPDETCTILYTSGTTGEPKGVMLNHAGFLENIRGTLDRINVEPWYVFLSFLPLSHLYERLAGHWCAMYNGATIHYSRGIEKVVEDLSDAHPHVLISVPRLYEKVVARIYDTVQQSSTIKQWLFNWAFNTGRTFADAEEAGTVAPVLRFKRTIAEKLVFGKIKARFGRNFILPVSGGAPLSPETLRFFRAMGLFIHEGYGMTETHLIIALTPPGKLKPGSCGKPLDNIQVRIAEDGEVLVKGPILMEGYYQRPDLTAEMIDADEWLHTGDIGHIDDDGYLYLTDRKKNIIVTAGGKNVAPAPIEGTIKKSPFIEEICLIGDKRKFISALVVPEFEILEKWAQGQALAFDTRETLVEQPEVQEKIWTELETAQQEFARYEKVKKCVLLPTMFTVDDGELTPSLKVKRRVVEERYAALIEGIYQE